MASRLESRKSSSRKSSSKVADRGDVSTESAHGRGVRAETDDRQLPPPPGRRSPDAPVARPANENEPSVAALISGLKRRPSAAPFLVASLISALWFIAYVAYLVSANSAEAERLGGFGQVIGQLPIQDLAVIIVMAVLPICLVWSISHLLWRAQQMRNVSQALVQTALRLIRPEDVANEGFATIGQAVRRELGQLVGGVEHAISRAGELETIVHKEISALERAFGGNEERIRTLLDGLEKQRTALEEAGFVLGSEANPLVNRLEQNTSTLQQIIDSASTTLHSLETGLKESTHELGGAIAEIAQQASGTSEQIAQQTGRLEQISNTVLQDMRKFNEQLGDQTDSLTKTTQALENSSTEWAQEVERVSSNVTTQMRDTSAELTNLLRTASSEFDDANGELVKSLDQTSEKITQRLRDTGTEFTTMLRGASGEFSEANAELARHLDRTTAKLTQQLRDVGSEVTELLQSSGGEVVYQMKEASHEVASQVEKTGAELTHHVEISGGAVTEKLLSASSDFVQNLDRAREQVFEYLATASGEMTDRVEHTTSRVFAKLKEANAEMSERLEQTSSRLFARLDQASSEMNNRLESTSTQIAEKLSTTSTEVFERIGDAGMEMSRQLTERSSEIVDRMSSTTGAITAQLSETGQHLFTQMETASQHVASAMENTGAEILGRFDSTTAHIAQTLDQAGTQMFSQLDHTTQTLSERLDEASASLTGRLDSTSTKLADALEQTGSHLVTRLDETSQTLSERLDQTSSQVTGRLDSTNKQFVTNLEDASGQLVNHLDDAADRIGKRLEQSSEHMSGWLEGASGKITERLDTVSRQLEDSVQGVNKEMERVLLTREETLNQLVERLAKKSEDVDSLMRSYVGLIEDSLSTAEQRADAVAGLLAENAGKTTEVLHSELLRLESSAGSQVDDLSTRLRERYEEAMRAMREIFEGTSETFNTTANDMRAVTRDLARELENARSEFKHAMFELPSETRENADEMRKVVSDQISALNALAEVVRRHGGTIDVSGPGVREQQSNHKPTQAARPANTGTGEVRRPAPVQNERPAPVQNERPAPVQNERPAQKDKPAPARRAPEPRPASGKLTLPEILKSASRTDDKTLPALSENVVEFKGSNNKRGGTPNIPRSALHIVESLNSLSVDLARALDPDNHADLWERYKKGERNVFTRRLYGLRSQKLFEEIVKRYRQEPEFRSDVDRYIKDFERLLDTVSEADRESLMVDTYLSSETGKVYLMLAHASGRVS